MKDKAREALLGFRQKNRLTFYLLCGVGLVLVIFGLYKIGVMKFLGVKEELENGMPKFQENRINEK